MFNRLIFFIFILLCYKTRCVHAHTSYLGGIFSPTDYSSQKYFTMWSKNGMNFRRQTDGGWIYNIQANNTTCVRICWTEKEKKNCGKSPQNNEHLLWINEPIPNDICTVLSVINSQCRHCALSSLFSGWHT